MNNRWNWLLGAGIGAVAMYYLDPARGRYRRALVRNQLVHAGHKAQRGVSVVRRDVGNRTTGVLAGFRSWLDFSRPDNEVLVQRVRSCLGRVVTHPSSVEVAASDGVVTLSGPILADEVRLLIDCVHHVRGVAGVRNELEVHTEPGNTPGLQGTPRPKSGARSELVQENWSPATRAAGGLGGALATLYGFERGGARGALVGAAGLLLAGRALTNLSTRRLLGIGASRAAVDVHKSIRIHAPVEDVFRLWSSFEDFPRFMTHVRRVRRVQTGANQDLWRWTIRGKSGIQVEFDAVVTAQDENRLLAWRTEDGGLLRHAGRVVFHENVDGSTTVDVRMVYNPVAGAVGHAIAWLIAADPKRQMDDDLLRMKTYLETGRRPRDAAEPSDITEDISERARLAEGAIGAEALPEHPQSVPSSLRH
jgi:uncharacterized membrane protein